jgi:hypothetical protein
MRMRTDESFWQEMDQRYQFNVIFDALEGGARGFYFLKRRLEDPTWALVYFHGKTYIMLKHNAQNATLIQKYKRNLILTP